MAEPLSQTERRVYEYLIDFLAEHTYQPSIREIGRRFRIKSTKTVSDILQALARKGYIERDPSRSRGVRLVGYTGVGGTTAVPYHGVLAGANPAVDASPIGHLVIDRRLASDRAFTLRVKGDANRAYGVLDGDYVVVDPSGVAADGALVAVREGASVALRPAAAGDTAKSLGVVTSVIRAFSESDPLAQPIVSQTAEVS